MAIRLNKGKVVVSEEIITIKRILGRSTVIQKHRIQSINKVGSVFYGIWLCIWIIGIPRGLRMLAGKRLITVKTYNQEYEFWLTNADYKILQNSL